MIILCGMTSTGKTTVAKELEKLGIKNIVTYTSRPMREGEVEGINYHYLTDEEFKVLDEQGYFIESTSYEVAGGSVWRYGTAIGDLKNDRCLVANPDGVKFYSRLSSLDTFIVYLFTNEAMIWNRLRGRGDDSNEARRRIEADREDFKDIMDYCDVAIKNDGSKTPEKMAKIIKDVYERWCESE